MVQVEISTTAESSIGWQWSTWINCYQVVHSLIHLFHKLILEELIYAGIISDAMGRSDYNKNVWYLCSSGAYISEKETDDKQVNQYIYSMWFSSNEKSKAEVGIWEWYGAILDRKVLSALRGCHSSRNPLEVKEQTYECGGGGGPARRRRDRILRHM